MSKGRYEPSGTDVDDVRDILQSHNESFAEVIRLFRESNDAMRTLRRRVKVLEDEVSRLIDICNLTEGFNLDDYNPPEGFNLDDIHGPDDEPDDYYISPES